MARLFAITTPKDTIELNAQGEGQATFTVSNSSGATARGRARVVPGDPVQARWYAIEGDTERSLRADQTTQYTVRAAVPKDTPKGEYTLRLDMVALDNTDEVAVEGPRVVIPCKGLPGPTPAGGFPKWLIPVIAAVVLLVGGGVVALLLTRGPAKAQAPDVSGGDISGKVEVPDVSKSGMLFEVARAALEGRGLKAERSAEVDKAGAEADTVLDQEPKPGSPLVEKGTVVKLTVVRAPVEVPRVTDMLVGSAAHVLEEKGLTHRVVDAVWLEGVSFGYVVKQEPSGHERVPHGSVVALTTVGNRSPLSDLSGVLDAALCEKIKGGGLYLECDSRADETQQHNFIVSYGGGPPFAAGQTVWITLARSPKVTEEVHKAEIKKLLDQYGLTSALRPFMEKVRAQVIRPDK